MCAKIIKTPVKNLATVKTSKKGTLVNAPKKYLKVQKVPHLSTRHGRRPAPNTLADQDDILEVMADSLINGMATLQGATWDPLLKSTYPKAFLPTPGRCVWTWDSIIQADPDAVDINPLLNLSLRSSDQFPDVLKSVTPHFCKLLTGMRNAELARCLNWLHDQDVLATPTSAPDISRAHALQGYGASLDAGLSLEDVLLQENPEPPPRNSRMTAEQYYSLRGAAPDATTPQATITAPPAPADLIPTLHRRFLKAADFLREKAREAAPNEDTKDLLEHIRTDDLTPHLPAVVTTYLRGSWETFRMSDPRLSTSEKAEAALLRAMIQVQWYRPYHFQSVLGAPILAGVSPACVVRGALDMLRRTSVSFLEERHIQDMIDAIRHLPKAKSAQAKANRSDLVEELNGLLKAFIGARDALSASMVDDVWRATQSTAVPAWGLRGPFLPDSSLTGVGEEDDDDDN